MIHSLKRQKFADARDSLGVSARDDHFPASRQISRRVSNVGSQPFHNCGAGNLAGCMDETRQGEISTTESHRDCAHVRPNGRFSLWIAFLSLKHYPSALRQRLEDMLGGVLIHSHRGLAAMLERSKGRVALRTSACAAPAGDENCKRERRACSLNVHASILSLAHPPASSRCHGRTQRRRSSAVRREQVPPAPARIKCCRGIAERFRQRYQNRHPCVRAGGRGVTSRSVLVDSAERTRTTTAVMLSLPPLTFAS